MIYELAEGNLEEFMLRNPTPSIDPAVFSNSWMVEQFCGIAHALLVVHEQEGSTGSGQRRHGYIHDIKPENILVYAYEGQTHCFRLSDFSCAKVVDFIATISGQHEMSHLTLSKTGTPNYRAPEVYHTGKTSRPYDLWSLGCVYLEIVTWYLQGYPALLAFRDARFGL
jgi:serine/threonine protein kinase